MKTYEGGEYDEYTFTYNEANQVATVEDPLGKVTSYGYDDTSGLLKTVTTPNGRTTSYGYDTDGNLRSVTAPKGNRTTYTYFPSGQVQTVVDPRGSVDGADPANGCELAQRLQRMWCTFGGQVDDRAGVGVGGGLADPVADRP